MKKIFHITSTNKFSGAEKIAMEIIQETQHEFDNYYLCKPGEIEKILKERKIKFITYRNKWDLLIKIKKHKPDILHCHDYTASMLGALSSVKRVFSHIHNNNPFAKSLNIKSLVYLLSSFRYKKIICVSNTIGNEMFFYPKLKKKIEVIYNWVNYIERRWVKKEGKSIDILFVGRFSEEKNPRLFVDIVQEVKKNIPSIKAVMVGQGELKEQVSRYILEENLSENIVIKDFTNEPHKYMKRSKAFLLTSNWEGFGLVILEAMLNEAIIISTPIGGAKEIVKDNKNGFLCKNKEEFVGKLKKILENQDDYREIVSEGTKTIDKYNMYVQIEKIGSLYNSQ